MPDPRAAFRSALLQAHASGALGQLSTSQRALLGAQHITTSHGGARHRGAGFQPLHAPVPYALACEALGVGEKTLGRAVRLHRSGRADLCDAVAAGRVTLAQAIREL